MSIRLHVTRAYIARWREAYDAGRSFRAIARDEGVSDKTVRYWLTRDEGFIARDTAAWCRGKGQSRRDRQGRRTGVPRAASGLSTSRIHKRLNERHPRVGVCASCGATGVRTAYAFLLHPFPHTDDISDYLELCQGCHSRMDAARKRKVDALFVAITSGLIDPRNLEVVAA